MLESALTNIGMFEAEMSSDSWQIAGMADRGILPAFLGARNQYDTPTLGILLSASGIVALCWMSFSEVVDMLNLLFCYGQAIEFFAFLYLRYAKPDMPRPFRIPIGFYGMCIVLAFPLAFIVVILYFSSMSALVSSVVLTMLGFVLYYMLEYARVNNWCAFVDRYAGDDNNNPPEATPTGSSSRGTLTPNEAAGSSSGIALNHLTSTGSFPSFSFPSFTNFTKNQQGYQPLNSSSAASGRPMPLSSSSSSSSNYQSTA